MYSCSGCKLFLNQASLLYCVQEGVHDFNNPPENDTNVILGKLTDILNAHNSLVQKVNNLENRMGELRYLLTEIGNKLNMNPVENAKKRKITDPNNNTGQPVTVEDFDNPNVVATTSSAPPKTSILPTTTSTLRTLSAQNFFQNPNMARGDTNIYGRSLDITKK